MKSGRGDRFFNESLTQCKEMVEPDANAVVQPSDPAAACADTGFSLSKAEESCAVLKAEHKELYEDCLIDECANGKIDPPEDELQVIKEVIEGEKAVDADPCNEHAVLQLKTPS